MRLIIALLFFLVVCGLGAVTYLALGLTWSAPRLELLAVATLTLAGVVGLCAWSAAE